MSPISHEARAKGIRNSNITRLKKRAAHWEFIGGPVGSGSGGPFTPTPALDYPVDWDVPEYAYVKTGIVTEYEIERQIADAAHEHFTVGEEWVA
jgi:hypothetical protein